MGRLVKHSPRYADWKAILQDEEIPLLSRNTVDAQLGGEKVQVYKVDIDRLKPYQREGLVNWIEHKFNTRRSEIYDAIDTEGFPIRESDVILNASVRHFL